MIEEKKESKQSKDEKDQEEEVDAKVFEQTNELTVDQRESCFECSQPVTKSGHIVYNCKGTDSFGEWKGERRYKEFHLLTEKLEQRWPGIPIPRLPEKKKVGNKELKFIVERKFYLDRFLKKLAHYPFILNETEFKIFSRPNGDISKLLDQIPKASIQDIVIRYEQSLQINPILYDPIVKDELNTICKEFQKFTKDIMPILQGILKELTSAISSKTQSIEHNKQYIEFLNKYEEHNLANYVDNDTTKMVLANNDHKETSNGVLKECVNEMCDSLKNPFFNLYHWCKGEIYDIQSVEKALAQRDKMQKHLDTSQKSKKNQENNLEAVNAGRKTVKTLIKHDAVKMAKDLEIADRNLEAQQTLCDLITIYLGETTIPDFRKKKNKIYKQIIQQYNTQEVYNSHYIASFWSQMLTNPNIKDIATLDASKEENN